MYDPLPYKAIIFDVKGTLTDGHSPRTETLVGTLQNLRRRGVLLLSVSSDSLHLTDVGFPDGLIGERRDARGLKDTDYSILLQCYRLQPKEVVCFGDDYWVDGSPAEKRGIRFIQVWGNLQNATEQVRMELENELAEIFGKDILGKPKVAQKPKKVEPASDLPKPRKWRRLNAFLNAVGIKRKEGIAYSSFERTKKDANYLAQRGSREARDFIEFYIKR